MVPGRALRLTDFPGLYWTLFKRCFEHDVQVSYESREAAEQLAVQLGEYRRSLIENFDDLDNVRPALWAMCARVDVKGSKVVIRIPKGHDSDDRANVMRDIDRC